MSVLCQERSFKEVESELACRALSPVSASEVIDEGPTRNAPSDADCRAPAMHRNPRVAHPALKFSPAQLERSCQVLVDLTLWQGRPRYEDNDRVRSRNGPGAV